jgi:hypothetical protein
VYWFYFHFFSHKLPHASFALLNKKFIYLSPFKVPPSLDFSLQQFYVARRPVKRLFTTSLNIHAEKIWFYVTAPHWVFFSNRSRVREPHCNTHGFCVAIYVAVLCPSSFLYLCFYLSFLFTFLCYLFLCSLPLSPFPVLQHLFAIYYFLIIMGVMVIRAGNLETETEIQLSVKPTASI